MSEARDQFELLCDYLEGTLAQGQRAEVEAMLKRDPALQRMLDEAGTARGALKSLPREVAPEPVRQAIAAEIASAQLRQARFSPRWMLRIAAALLLTFTLGVIGWQLLPAPDLSPMAMDTRREMAKESITRAPAEARAMREEGDFVARSRRAEPEVMADAGPLATAAPTPSPAPSAAPAPPVQPATPPAALQPGVFGPAAGVAAQADAMRADNFRLNAEATLIVRGADAAALTREIQTYMISNNVPAELNVAATGQRAAADADAPAAAGEEGRLAAKAVTPAGAAETIVVRDNSFSQLESIRRDIIALAARNNAQVVDLALGDQRGRRQQTLQFQRAMPSAQQQQMQQALSQMERQELGLEEPPLYDLTIIIIEQQRLPATTPTPTLPGEPSP